MLTYSLHYISGVIAAVYTTISLLCGLQLYGNFFIDRLRSNLLVSRVMGIIFLMMASAGLCYIVAEAAPSLSWLVVVGVAIDLMMFTGLACVAHILYSNNQPSIKTLFLLALPYVVIIGLYFVLPMSWHDYLIDIAVFLLMALYFCYAFRMRHRERLLEDLYSNPESHSLKWIWGIIAMNAGWWIIRFVFGVVDCLNDWMDIAAYFYMVGYVLLIFVKVINYGEPVSLDTQKVIEEEGNNNQDSLDLDDNGNVKRLKELMENEQLYLNPDLTVEDVARCLDISPQYLSIFLHSELQISFAQFVNGYRVERAKKLLLTTDEKVEYIALTCGFNSRQTFRRIFSAITGTSPADFRNQI